MGRGIDLTGTTSMIEVTVFNGTELKGSRRFDRLADSEAFIENVRYAGLRALPLSPIALQGWAEHRRSAPAA
jgi:hypothetical protein